MLAQPLSGFEGITSLLEMHAQRIGSLRAEKEKQNVAFRLHNERLIAALALAQKSGTAAEEIAQATAIVQANKSKEETAQAVSLLMAYDVNAAKALVYGAATWQKIEKQLDEFVAQGKVNDAAVEVFKSCFANLWIALQNPETSLVALEGLVSEFYNSNPIPSELTQKEAYNELWYGMMLVIDYMCWLTVGTILLATLDASAVGLGSLAFYTLFMLYDWYKLSNISFAATECTKNITDLKNVAEFYQDATAPLATRPTIVCKASAVADSQHSSYSKEGAKSSFFLPAKFDCKQEIVALADSLDKQATASLAPVL